MPTSVADDITFRMAALAVALLLAGCGETERNDERATTAQPVTTTIARAETLPITAAGIGSFTASEAVVIRPEVAGRVAAIPFEEGATVEQGDLLFRLDDAELQDRRQARENALEAARVDLTNAEWKFERVQELRARRRATDDEFKDARDAVNAAQAEVGRLEAEVALLATQIDDTRVRAPFDGVTGAHAVDVGDFVDIGDPLGEIYRIDPLELSFTLSEQYTDRLRVGQPVTATTPAFPDETFSGQVDFIDPALAINTRELRLKSEIPNPQRRLKPGLFANVEVTLDEITGQPVIPEECLVSKRTGYVVFVVDAEQIARQRAVTLGPRRPGRVAITAGLEPGAEVVQRGQMRLSDGDKVRITNEDDRKPAAGGENEDPDAPTAGNDGEPASSGAAP
jgi:membrane fusion protein (multidrug efflux system)